MKYKICVTFKDMKMMQFVADKYCNDGQAYIFTSDVKVQIISCDVVRHIEIERLYLL